MLTIKPLAIGSTPLQSNYQIKLVTSKVPKILKLTNCSPLSALKKEVYVVVAVARETRLIVGQAVLTHRSQEDLQKLVDELPVAERYCTDGFTNYAELVWPQDSQHVISQLKEETFTIEGLNADLRTYLGRLARRSRCFSRSLQALRRALRLFTWHYNRRQRLINANPKFKSHLCLVF